MNDNLTLYLLTIRGTLSPATLEEARKVHNRLPGTRTVSLPQNPSATSAIWSTSRWTMMDMRSPKAQAEFLIMDLWTSIGWV